MSSHPRYPRHITDLKPYVAGLPIATLANRLQVPAQTIAKLASNENPLGASPRALQALRDASLDLSRYPDTDTPELTNALAGFHGIPREWIVTGAGSESLLCNAVTMLLEPGARTAYSEFSFQTFPNAVQRAGASHLVIPSPEYKVDLEALARAVDDGPSLIYIANPGNPTGTCVPPAALLQFLEAVPQDIVVLLDEAYHEFLPPELRTDAVAWVRRFPNLLVTRTFSKAYGLAGLRVGYAIAQPALADMLRRVRSPFTVSHASQIAAAAAIEDQEFIARTLENNNTCRELLCNGLRELGVPFLESHTNFVLAKVGDGSAFARRIEQHGIIVRPVNSYGLPEWIRMSVGGPQESVRLLEAMRAELRSAA
jgi:histidinol-phosphate aminotransferase